MGGLLLSFSRAAWGQFVLCALVLLALTFVTSRSPSERLRIVLLAIVGVAAWRPCSSRRCCRSTRSPTCSRSAPRSTQSYDVGHTAGSAATVLGAPARARHPFGIGPLQFQVFPEAPHNSYLNAFMSGGWLAGVCLSDADAGDAGLRAALRVRAHALAADLPSRSMPPISASSPRAHHRQRPLAPLFPAPRRAVGLDGGVARLSRGRDRPASASAQPA